MPSDARFAASWLDETLVAQTFYEPEALKSALEASIIVNGESDVDGKWRRSHCRNLPEGKLSGGSGTSATSTLDDVFFDYKIFWSRRLLSPTTLHYPQCYL